MKAILFNKYGSPDVLELTEADKPTPKDHQVLIKVKAASANPLDWHRMRGAPFLVRLSDGFSKPKDPRIGADIAGTVEAVGKDVTKYKVGDEVFGCIGAGGFAEYVAVSEKAAGLFLKPANTSFEAAAAAPVAAITALQGLRDSGKIQAGQKVLINGAGGGVGSYAVQIAKHFGAEVTAVCGTDKVEMVRSIGADHVIDYTKENFTKSGKQYDLIYDAVGNHSVGALKRALTAEGIGIVTGYSGMPHVFRVMIGSKMGSPISQQPYATPTEENLRVIKELLETGKIQSVIGKTYPLAETAAAIRYLEAGHAKGKVVIAVA